MQELHNSATLWLLIQLSYINFNDCLDQAYEMKYQHDFSFMEVPILFDLTFTSVLRQTVLCNYLEISERNLFLPFLFLFLFFSPSTEISDTPLHLNTARGRFPPLRPPLFVVITVETFKKPSKVMGNWETDRKDTIFCTFTVCL